MNARLTMELDAVRATLARTRRAQLRSVSSDGLLYRVEFEVRTLVRAAGGTIREEERVVPVAFNLTPSHPMEHPVAVALQADLFNPHINSPQRPGPLPPIPIICLGEYRVGALIADWLPATFYLLAWARIATNHGLDPDAMAYAQREMASGRFPIDRRDFTEPTRRKEIPS
jgi:hypothetical protein